MLLLFVPLALTLGLGVCSPVKRNTTSQTASAFVDLDYSQYQGSALEIGINEYIGMRFAAPPLGDLRWRAPADPVVTNGTQPATSYGPICLGTGNTESTSIAEDCLYINVWAPSDATPDSKLPVWLFIQGGGYQANSNANYNATGIVADSGMNVVFVSFNYRVGAWGFLASEKVRADGELNVGLLDQRKVFEWVQKYITRFGGDPDHVTIHGVSAGAGSTTLHLTAYGGRNDGLFHAAIGESVFFPTQPKLHELEWQFDRYAAGVGCNGTSDVLACMRALDTATLQAANDASPFPGEDTASEWYWTPTVEGDLIQDYPYVLLEQGKIIKVPILYGDDNNEGSYFTYNASTPQDFEDFFQWNYPHLTDQDTRAIVQHYPKQPPLPDHAPWFPSASEAYGEACFTCPGIFISQTWASDVSPTQVWNYRYNVLDKDSLAAGDGVGHTAEIPAVFGPTYVSGASSLSTYNADIVPVVQSYFTSFVRAFDPNTYRYDGSPDWKPFGHSETRIVLQTNQTRLETVPESQKDRCAFWKSLAVVMEV